MPVKLQRNQRLTYATKSVGTNADGDVVDERSLFLYQTFHTVNRRVCQMTGLKQSLRIIGHRLTAPRNITGCANQDDAVFFPPLALIQSRYTSM